MTAVATPVNHFPDAHSRNCRNGMACGHPAACCTCLASDFKSLIDAAHYQLDVPDGEQAFVFRAGDGTWSFIARNDRHGTDWISGSLFADASDAVEAALNHFEDLRAEEGP